MLSSKAHWLSLVESGRKSFGDLPHAMKTLTLCHRMVGSDPVGVLRHAPRRVREHPDFPVLCRDAVGVSGMALEYVPRDLPGYAVLCFEAVQQDGRALRFVPRDVMTEGLCLEAVLNAPDAMAFVPPELRAQVEAGLAGT